MQKLTNPQKNAVSLPLQTSLDHRQGISTDVATLFPAPETFGLLGGRDAVARLVDGLYDRIEADTFLRPAFNRDLARERKKQKRFFETWLGGADNYFGEWGKPGLKAVHAGIKISRGMAGRWVGHFLDSLAAVSADERAVAAIKPVVARLAMALVNRASEPAAGEQLRRRCSSKETQQFARYIQRDDAAGIRASVAEHPQAFVVHGADFLVLASVRGKVQAVRELLSLGVDANGVDRLPGSEASIQGLPPLPMTPLCAALAKRRDAVVHLLLENGAQYDIFTASFLGDGDAMHALLDRCPELANACDPACDVARITPLVHAVSTGQLDAVRLLFECGATVGVNHRQLIRAAANAGDEALTDVLLEQGADPSDLGAGAWVLYPGLAGKLSARGANVNREPGAWIGRCCTGNSGHKENEPLARAFLRFGADVTARYKGRTALHCAAKAGFLLVVRALIEYGADVQARDENGITPLGAVEEAAPSIDKEPVRQLLRSVL